MNNQFTQALELIDAANGVDPNQEAAEGKDWPKELLYSVRMSEMLDRFYPKAGELARLAVRAQHIQRWQFPRDAWPATRHGYLAWRTELYKFHAERLGAILKQVGYADEFIEEAKKAVGKRGLKVNASTQLVEDIADLVFLEYYLEPFAAKHDYDEAKWCDILQKTWRKMSPEARTFALSGKVRLPQPLVPVLNKALADFAD
jgi:hypothetical protein